MTVRRCLSALLAAAGFFVLTAVGPLAAGDENWPQWRGPDGLGVAKAETYADEWSPEKNIAWKTPVEGRGHSSPVIWGNYLFVTTSIRGGPSGHKAPDHLGYDMKPGYRNPDSEEADYAYTLKVLAYDSRTGKALWERTAYEGIMWEERHKRNTYASNTIATCQRRWEISPKVEWGTGPRRCCSRTSSSFRSIRKWARARPSWRSTRTPAGRSGAPNGPRGVRGERRFSSAPAGGSR